MKSIIEILLEHGTITPAQESSIMKQDMPQPFIAEEPHFKTKIEPRHIVDEDGREIDIYESDSGE